MISLSNAKRLLVSAAAGLLGVLVGCAAPPQATNLSDELAFEQALNRAYDAARNNLLDRVQARIAHARPLLVGNDADAQPLEAVTT